MKAEVEQHPDYPFRPGRQAALDSRAGGFLDAPPASGLQAGVLREFIALSHSFAFLERLIQGEIICDLPAHASRILSGGLRDPEEEGERLAEFEVGLLEWSPGASESLAEALDTIGVKVFQLEATDEEGDADLAEGNGSEGPGLTTELFGAFAFEAEVGPAILAGTGTRSPATNFVLAHEYGHLVADIDPYRSRFCRWDRESLDNRSDRPEEARADRFARSLLMPASAIWRAFNELGPVAEGQEDPRIDQLAAVFEVSGPLIRRRLRDLGIPSSGESRSAGAPHRRRRPGASRPETGSDPGAVSVRGRIPLPERFVNLALAAYAGRVLDLPTLSLFLRTTEEEARRVVDWAGVRPMTDFERDA